MCKIQRKVSDDTVSLGGIDMAAQNQEQHPTLSLEDVRNYYNAGTQQHNNEFRTLGDRANAFLLTQSIFFAALILILIYQNKVAVPFIIMAGIILLGISFCILYIRAGRSGAYSAYAWSKYLRHLENKHPDAPWNWFAKYFERKTEKAEKEAKCCITKFLMKRYPWVIDEGALATYLTLPSVWIFSTIAFLVVWTCASVYIYINVPETAFPLRILFGVIAGLLLFFAVYLLCQAWKAWKHPYSDK